MTLPEKKLLNFLMSSLHSDHFSSNWNFWKSERDLQFSSTMKSSFWSAILGDVVFSINEVITGSVFICRPLMLHTASAAVMIRIIRIK